MPEVYTKDDYLTADKYAKKYGLTKEIVERAIKISRVRKASIIIARGGVKREITVSMHGRYHIRPEPAAHEALNKIIQEMQSKGESK
ncbi:MAG: hypothetical protein J6T57_01770 [Alphaproteobacteria bacterium]|nr:hypothetical protein [Alphaproteobacteria bacterium]